MRDVINKNVTEEHITASAEKIFSRGWSRMKCYFMIGLPTETDEDVEGIAQTGGRLRRLGKKIRKDADVTVSVSSHVPKPHTPFQWAKMDSVDELRRKQRILREVAFEERIKLKHHEVGGSYVEGILSRGDRRLADVIETVWKNGARFCGWEEHFDLQRWEAALDQHHIDRETYLGTRAVDAPQPWDHLDVGLQEGFLAWEYRRALKNRLSPPCGKPNKTLLHHTNIEDAEADHRKLVCYDCGIACDMTEMRDERIDYLKTLDARKIVKLPVVPSDGDELPSEPHARGEGPRPMGFAQNAGRRYRLRFGKRGRGAFVAHLDTMRMLIRVFRRAEVELIYSKGFHPKPLITFGPALGLGVQALAEVCDIVIDPESSKVVDDAELLSRLREASPDGLVLDEIRALGPIEPPLAKILGLADFVAWLPEAPTLRAPTSVIRDHKGQAKETRTIDVASYLVDANLCDAAEAARLRRVLAWPQDGVLLAFRVRLAHDGGVKPTEVIEAVTGKKPVEEARYARLGVYRPDGIDVFAPSMPPPYATEVPALELA
jgi:radical SAM-linked protein